MWLVRLALRRPYTFTVVALLIAVLGGIAIWSMPDRHFPPTSIFPVVSVIWNYSGIPPEEMANRIATVFERAMTTTVNDIEHIESTSYPGVTVIRAYFQPNAKVETAIAQITSDFAERHPQHAARDLPSLHRQVQRFQRPHPATEHQQQDPAGTGPLRLRAELHPDPTGHGAGRFRALAIRRQDAQYPGGSGSRRSLRKAAVRHRSVPGGESSERDSARRGMSRSASASTT